MIIRREFCTQKLAEPSEAHDANLQSSFGQYFGLFSLDPRELRPSSASRAFTASNLPSLSDFILTVCRLCAFGTKAASCVSSSAASTCALGLGILRELQLPVAVTAVR